MRKAVMIAAAAGMFFAAATVPVAFWRRRDLRGPAAGRGRVRPGLHGVHGRADRGRQAEDLVDRQQHHRPEADPRGEDRPRHLPGQGGRVRDEEVRPHGRHRCRVQELQSFTADGGGDDPESVNQALHDAVTGLSWSADRTVLKIIFLVGDYPPHMDYPDDVKYPESCRLAVKKDLIINTVQCGDVPETTPVWQDIARLRGRLLRRAGAVGEHDRHDHALRRGDREGERGAGRHGRRLRRPGAPGGGPRQGGQGGVGARVGRRGPGRLQPRQRRQGDPGHRRPRGRLPRKGRSILRRFRPSSCPRRCRK